MANMKELLEGLENLKLGLEKVGAAREDVERTVAAANKVNKGFASCGESLRDAGNRMNKMADSMAKFSRDLTGPVSEKINELGEASSTLMDSAKDVLDQFSVSCGKVQQDFDETVNAACENLNARIAQFRKELVSFTKAVSRTNERTESSLAENMQKLASQGEFAEAFRQEVQGSFSGADQRLTEMGEGLTGSVVAQSAVIQSYVGEAVEAARAQNQSDLEACKTTLSEALDGCRMSVEACQRQVKTVRFLSIIALMAVVCLFIAFGPIIKAAWK